MAAWPIKFKYSVHFHSDPKEIGAKFKTPRNALNPTKQQLEIFADKFKYFKFADKFKRITVVNSKDWH